MKARTLLTALLALTLVASIAVAAKDKSEAEKKKPKPINDVCPLTGKKINASKLITVKSEYCCKRCQKKFLDDVAGNIAKLAKAEDGKCLFSGRDASVSDEVVYGVCCGGCFKKATENPKKVLAKVKPAQKKESKKGS